MLDAVVGPVDDQHFRQVTVTIQRLPRIYIPIEHSIKYLMNAMEYYSANRHQTGRNARVFDEHGDEVADTFGQII